MTKSKIEEDIKSSPEKELEELREKFNELLNDDRIELAAIIIKTKGDEEPHVYRKGHFYDVASAMNFALEAYRYKAKVDLGL